MPNLADKQEQEAGRNVPKLRFPEFSGEWEKLRVSDLLEFFSTNSLSWEQLEYGGEGILNLHYGLIHNGLPTQINLDECTLPTVKPDFSPRKYTLCKDGDVAFADASEDTKDVGKVVEFMNCADKKIVCGLHTIHGRDKLGKTIPGFKGYAFSSPAFHKQIRRIAQGTKIFSINTGNFEETFIGIPNKEEQNKIASLLSLIDRRIAIQNRVIELYESLIKAIRHNIFKNICGEVVSLSNIADIYQPQTISSSDLTTEGYWVYGANGVIGKYKDYNHETEQICITCRGNTCGTVNYTPSQVWITGNSMVINTDRYSKQVYKRFLFHYLSSYNFTSIVSGSGQPQIVRTPLEKIKITLSIIEKQKRIANGLDTMLEKVDTERAVLVLLDNQKRYHLRQLFI